MQLHVQLKIEKKSSKFKNQRLLESYILMEEIRALHGHGTVNKRGPLWASCRGTDYRVRFSMNLLFVIVRGKFFIGKTSKVA